MSTIGLILAAGSSSRMGRPKQLLDWGGRPLVRVVAEHALAAALDQVLVVTGAEQYAVEQALADLPVRFIHNPHYAEGQSGSLRVGVAALPTDAEQVLVLLGDQPFVTPAIINAILAAGQRGAAIVAPHYAGVRGNPVLFARPLFAELLAIRGDQGARSILAADPARITMVTFDDPRPQIDIDTPEIYAELAPPRE
ncbi:MAG: hypothetical protein OHK0050_40470 [Roseiflexaceae bacterium]